MLEAIQIQSKPLQRYRGLVLNAVGWKKLQARIRQLEKEKGYKYTPKRISQQTQLIDNQGLHLVTVKKIWRRQVGVDYSSLSLVFRALGLELEPTDCKYFQDQETRIEQEQPSQKAAYNPAFQTLTDWGEAPDPPLFLGRGDELALLERWIVGTESSGARPTGCCRIVEVLGIGGVGKTSLAVELAKRLHSQFEAVIWRSLRDAPPPDEALADIERVLFLREAIDLSESNPRRISRLVEYLRHHRCLLVLDNLEAILDLGEYRAGYEGYGQLIERMAKCQHQSCLVLTSREKPKALAKFEGASLPVHCLFLSGLPLAAVKEIFRAKGDFFGSESAWHHLNAHYGGNPLALEIVATAIQELFAGNVEAFWQQGKGVLGEIGDLLEQQFNRLSAGEREILDWLAINREPVSVKQLAAEIVLPDSGQLLDSLSLLRGRSLIETIGDRFTVQPFVSEYITDKLVQLRRKPGSQSQIEFRLPQIPAQLCPKSKIHSPNYDIFFGKDQSI